MINIIIKLLNKLNETAQQVRTKFELTKHSNGIIFATNSNRFFSVIV